MLKFIKRLFCLGLALLLILGLCACSFETPDILDNGASNFADGKEEEDYSPVNSGTLLDDLIRKYSGSFQKPTGKPMTDDEFDNAKDQIGGGDNTPVDTTPGDTTPDDTIPGDTQPNTGGDDTKTILQVGSWEDFMDAFQDVYEDTEIYLEFEVVNGFTFDPYTDLDHCYRELQRIDPIYISGVAGWSWGQEGDYYLFEISYTMDVDTLIAMKDQTDALADAAVASLNTAGMSDYEIICAVNEYLCDTIYYPPEPYAAATHTPYGAFADGVAVCEGYATAAKLMLNRLGILCDIQIGTCTNGGGHAWNLVYLDGEWYQLDVTWNDGSRSRTDYLLVTDEYMLKSRTWDFSNYPSSADEPYKP